MNFRGFRSWPVLVGGALVVAAAVFLLVPRADPPTFGRDVAPIVHANCTQCHRAGGAGPFPLVEYRDVKKRARLIAEVTEEHAMPPWPPAPAEPGAHFVGERRLSMEQIHTLRRWAESGAREGPRVDFRPPPEWQRAWQLGEPDLVVAMPEAYTLPAEGRDVYRNFVVPIPMTARRYVRAIEMHPGDPRLVHHAFVFLDRTGTARQTDAAEEGPGYAGMNPGPAADTPGGHFLSWAPGRTPAENVAGTQWPLEPGTDAIFQLHLRPTGKPEAVKASVAFYFTDEEPTKDPYRLLLRSTQIDIPAGESNYAIESSYNTPVDLEVLAVLPHAHYLGRDLQGWAELPDGSRRTLLHIPRWDFNWQGDYRYAQPVALPAGTTLRMRYTYDNSAANRANPSPPRRVLYGEETGDEMGELWLQVLTHSAADRARLHADYEKSWMQPDAMARARVVLARNPRDVATRTNLAGILILRGEAIVAEAELMRVLEIDPEFAQAHSHLSHLYMWRNDAPRAKAALEKVVALTPEDFQAQNNLGWVLLVEGDAARAAEHFERALALKPDHSLARSNLAKARKLMEKAAPR